MFRDAGFSMPVVTYCPLRGLNTYRRDEAAHAGGRHERLQPVPPRHCSQPCRHTPRQANWLPVYWNIGDEPIGDDLTRSAENAEAYRAGVSHGSAVFHGGQFVRRFRRHGPAFPLVPRAARRQLEPAR